MKKDDNVFGAAQLLLSEKRTSLSILRTGASLFVIPLSVLSLLIATSKFYEGKNIMHLMIPVFVICAGLTVLSITLILRALKHLRHYDQQLQTLKSTHPVISELID